MTRATLHKHEKIGITFAQFGALLGLRELLKRGYVHYKKAVPPGPGLGADYELLAEKAGSEHIINMGVGCRGNEHCGSVGCIGGTMGLLMGMNADHADQFVGGADKGPLRKLFYPPRPSDYNSITGKQVVRAIDNFIKYDGDPEWDKILTLKQWTREQRNLHRAVRQGSGGGA